MFGLFFILISTLMLVFVFFRASSLPFIKNHISAKTMHVISIILWVLIYFSRSYAHNNSGLFAEVLEFVGMTLFGTLFLLFISLLPVETITVFGFFFRKLKYKLRTIALLIGLILAVFSLFQGLRAPTISNYDIQVSNLPKKMNGTKIIAISDLHLGSLIGENWINKLVKQIQTEKPDIIFLLGDIFEGHEKPEDKLFIALNKLRAPLGVWAVAGNHELHGDRDTISYLSQETSIQVLSNKWIEIRSGFILAGISDLTYFYRSNKKGNLISETLSNRPKGTTILLSHTPWDVKVAAKENVDLMLSGHTHGGQIWPFRYLISLRYPLVSGEYIINGMPIIVCRGTGTWGPRMRLWRPGEIIKITLNKF